MYPSPAIPQLTAHHHRPSPRSGLLRVSSYVRWNLVQSLLFRHPYPGFKSQVLQDPSLRPSLIPYSTPSIIQISPSLIFDLVPTHPPAPIYDGLRTNVPSRSMAYRNQPFSSSHHPSGTQTNTPIDDQDEFPNRSSSLSLSHPVLSSS